MALRSTQEPSAHSPSTSTFRESRPSSNVSRFGSNFSERRLGTGGVAGIGLSDPRSAEYSAGLLSDTPTLTTAIQNLRGKRIGQKGESQTLMSWDRWTQEAFPRVEAFLVWVDPSFTGPRLWRVSQVSVTLGFQKSLETTATASV